MARVSTLASAAKNVVKEIGLINSVPVTRDGRIESLIRVRFEDTAVGVNGAVMVRSESLVICDFSVVTDAVRSGSGGGMSTDGTSAGGGRGSVSEVVNWSMSARVVEIAVCRETLCAITRSFWAPSKKGTVED